MVRGVIIFILVIFGYFPGKAINDPLVGGRSASLGGTSVSLQGFWSVFNNQAGIASYKKIAIGISYENRFLLHELSTKNAALILPVQNGAFGISLSYYGFELYNKKKVGLAYSRKFGKQFSAGLQIDYLGIRIGSEYGKKDLFTFEAGVQAKLSKNLRTGFHIFNPPQIKLSDQFNERIPVIARFGITYLFSEKVLSVIEFEKSNSCNPILKCGLEYKNSEKVTFRTGISTNSFRFSFGAGFCLGKIVLDLASSYHPDLGFISQVSMILLLRVAGDGSRVAGDGSRVAG